MDLSLDEAAVLLGKSARQLRYLVAQGRIPARKEGTRWMFRREDLPISQATQARREQHLDALTDIVEDTLQIKHRPPRFSLADLKAFQVCRPLYLDVVAAHGAEHAAALALKTTLLALGAGCHRFHPADKTAAYRDARDAASAAATELMINDPDSPLARRVEQELMPAVAGLLRRIDRRGGRP